MKNIRYGFSDLIISEDQELPKYITVYDTYGNVIGEVETYMIEEEHESEE